MTRTRRYASLTSALFPCLVLGSAAAQTGEDNTAPLPEGAPQGCERITQENLKEYAVHLASDELGGRYTGMPGQVQAAEYIRDHFKKLGLAPLGDKARGKRDYFQRFKLERTYLDPKKTSLVFGGETYKTGFAVTPGKDRKAVRGTGQFVYCGTGNPDHLPKSLKRKIPVVLLKSSSGGPRAAMRGSRQVLRARDVNRTLSSRHAKVVVFLIVDDNSGVMDSMNTSALLPEKHALANPAMRDRRGRGPSQHSVPSVYLPPEKSKALLALMGYAVEGGEIQQVKSKAKASGKVYVQVREDKKFEAINVCAVLEGTSRKSEALVYSAHMDHMGIRMDGDRFNGADDNASGSSGLLAIAQAFATAQPKPKRSVIFLSVSGEELGLWGSRHYSEEPTWPLRKIIANINIDMIGRHTSLSPANVVSVTPSKDHKKFSTLVRSAAEIADRMGMSLSNGDTYYLRSDHYNFARKGIPVVFFCDGEHQDYHQVTDHADKLDYPKMEQIARLAFWTGWETCNAAGRPKDLGKQDRWTVGKPRKDTPR